MKTHLDKLQEAADHLRENGAGDIDTAVVLGTGLGRLIDLVEAEKTFLYSDVPHFPEATVESHHGRMVVAKCGKRRLLIFQGRFHQYEGYAMEQVVFPVRVAKLAGARELLLSNAAGGLHPGFKKRDLVLISDHINLQTANPLTGRNIGELGPRFPDLSAPYDAQMQVRLKTAAQKRGHELKEGVYAAVNGPNLETRAEYKFLRTIGADMVGMSTVPEVIAAAHMRMPCAAISVITDECDPACLAPATIEEIIATARDADQRLAEIFLDFLNG